MARDPSAAQTARRRIGVERRLEQVAAAVDRDPAAVTERARDLVAGLARLFERLDRGGEGGRR